MSVVKINAISVPDGAGEELEARFAKRLGAVENMEGFEAFELLRPVAGEDRYFVYTRWSTEQDFQNWRSSQQFQHGHTGEGKPEQRPPVSSGSALLEFEVVERV